MSIESSPAEEFALFTQEELESLEGVNLSEIDTMLQLLKREDPDVVSQLNITANRLAESPATKAAVLAGLVALAGTRIYSKFRKDLSDPSEDRQ